MTMRKLVLVGNGMAGVRCIEEILKINPEQFEITIIGGEPHPNYNRILLSSVLAGDANIQDIVLNDWDWYERNGIRLYTGQTVTKIDSESKQVYTDNGNVFPYDDLILATGSLPLMLPIPGADKEGVIAFRDIKDCETMMEAAKLYQKAVVIGGGLLGLEAARGLLNLSMDVKVVHIFDNLMERQLDPIASKMLQSELEKQGMQFLLEKETIEILGDHRVTGLRFKDGSIESADIVVMAIGIQPNVTLAEDSGILVNRGIIVNDFMETSVTDIYALGECTEHRGTVYGLVAPLFEQAQLLAKHLCGKESIPYEGSIVYTKLKISGIDVFSAGEFIDSQDTSTIQLRDEFEGVYKKVLIRDGRIVGAVLYGDTQDGQRLFKMIRDRSDVAGKTSAEILGNVCQGTNSSVDIVATMADDEIVCGCGGVTKGAILQAIHQKGCSTVSEIKEYTGATRSCGGCKPLVAKILASVTGKEAAYSQGREPICSCTSLSRDEVVAKIREMHLTNVLEVMSVLGWHEPEGCSKCRPALNYYLNMLWPEEHQDEPASRFVNERIHANIQKDGTYAVIPRIYGGVTTPDQLKKIVEVAEKYNVGVLKITGGQRIALPGFKKHQLPQVYADLDMPSGYAYAKAIRSVKTCVGSLFCRFGLQNSVGLGIELEKKFERLNAPAKLKFGVSGCPRSCAESSVKDVGIVGIEGGWEVYVGGNGGIKPRLATLFHKFKTEEELKEWVGAFLQYYRENASYGERTSEFVERIGLVEIQNILSDQEMRQALNERIEQALAVLDDPWKSFIETESDKLFQEITL